MRQNLVFQEADTRSNFERGLRNLGPAVGIAFERRLDEFRRARRSVPVTVDEFEIWY